MKQEISYKEIDNNELKQSLLKLFSIKYISIGEIKFGGAIIIVTVEFNDYDSLSKEWKEFNSHILTEVSSLQKDDFSKWNLYVFYVSKEVVSKELKYEIENNKFGSRKIIPDKWTDDINKETIIKLLRRYITMDEIDVSSKKITKSILNKNIIIKNAIGGKDIPRKKSDQGMYFDSIIDKIKTSINDEI